MKNVSNKIKANRLGRPRLLLIGCGDVGMRLLPLMQERFRVFAVTSQASRCMEIRAAGAIPIVANLDQPHTLARLSRLADRIVHLVPPQSEGNTDRRTRHLTAILPDRTTLVYVSTTGVYGDCKGERVDETRRINPHNSRAVRRADAEASLRQWARRSASRLVILRVPGIYAANRLPIERLQKGTPALLPEEDVYTNHVHADDLAYTIAMALYRGLPCRIYHAADDSEMKMGDYFDSVAETFQLNKPPRLPRSELQKLVSPVLLSFMSESRRLENRRIKTELGVSLRYPSVDDALRAFKNG